MALCTLVRENYDGRLTVSIKCDNVILLCQSILETRRISHLYGSAFFTVLLKAFIKPFEAPSVSVKVKM